MTDFLVYLVTGKLFIWLARKFPPLRLLFYKREFSRELFDCDMCLGFWVYLILSFFFNINVEPIKNRFMNNTVLAGGSTLIAHLISLGWKEQFGEIWIDNVNG